MHDSEADAERPDFRALQRQVAALRTVVVAEGAKTLASWNAALGESPFLESAENLAQYLALRRQDLSDLQGSLALHGLSSLGRSEARVLAALDSVLATLSRLAGQQPLRYPSRADMDAGSSLLRAAQERLFGADPKGQYTRIMATLPTEAGSDDALVRRLVGAGMNCARINCAHDGPEVWAAMIANVRAAAAHHGRDCRILMDIAGPKCRIESVHVSDNARLKRGDRVVLVRDLSCARAGDTAIATISFPHLLERLAPGAEVWIDDGKIGARVHAVEAGRAVLDITAARSKGERLKAEKGVNFPDLPLDLPPLGPDDLIALDFVAEHADLIGYSFVQRPDDLRLLDRELARRGGAERAAPQPVILKIETRTAVENLPQLIVTAAASRPVGVMIARGDLAVELGFARLSEIQEELLWLCEAAHVPVIWATQVLDNLVGEGTPSRAETTDAAMSQRAECVMLNKGPYLAEGIAFLKDILSRMDRHQAKKFARFGPLKSWTNLAVPQSQVAADGAR